MDLQAAILASDDLRRASWAWELYTMKGDTPASRVWEIRNKMKAHNFSVKEKAMFVVATAGLCARLSLAFAVRCGRTSDSLHTLCACVVVGCYDVAYALHKYVGGTCFHVRLRRGLVDSDSEWCDRHGGAGDHECSRVSGRNTSGWGQSHATTRTGLHLSM